MLTIRQAYQARGFVLGCEVFAELQEYPDDVQVFTGSDRPAPDVIYLTRGQVHIDGWGCAIAAYYPIDCSPSVADVRDAFAEVWQELRLTSLLAEPRAIQCGAIWSPGVLRPPGQPSYAGRCSLPRGHEGSHDFPLARE